MKDFLSSYKTTISAVLVLILTGLFMFSFIDQGTFAQILGVFVVMGFISSADADKIKKL